MCALRILLTSERSRLIPAAGKKSTTGKSHPCSEEEEVDARQDTEMGLFHAVCMGLLVVVARAQVLQNCSVGTSALVVGSTEDAAALVRSLSCSNGDFAVQWIGEIFLEETIYVTSGTSLNITGAGPGAIADGRNSTQLFHVEGGSSLHLSGMTLSNANSTVSGGAVFANLSTVSFHGNMSFISNAAGNNGGAIYASESAVSWDGDGTQFSKNSAGNDGGAIYALFSTVSWNGDDTRFSSNHAGKYGGAILAVVSTLTWDGDGTQFSFNNAASKGGAIYATSGSTVSWYGDGTEFISNEGLEGSGGILALRSTIFWYGDATSFSNNSADATGYGGAIGAHDSEVSWFGYTTTFTANSALGGGAIAAFGASSVSWEGYGTEFISNAAGENGGAINAYDGSTVSWAGGGTIFFSNSAGLSGGAIYSWSNSIILCLAEDTNFSGNAAAENGGALALTDLGLDTFEDGQDHQFAEFTSTSFTNNRAGINGGALYSENFEGSIKFVNVTFQSNLAGTAGGAFAAYGTGGTLVPYSYEGETMDRDTIAMFSGCTFLKNQANGTGGAVDALLGIQQFISCKFEGNSADVGGAMRLAGTAIVGDCSFVSNFATSRGLAVTAAASTTISDSSFDRNDLYCAAGSYREDSEEGPARYEAVCLDCPDWDECSGCTIAKGYVTPVCEVPPVHTTASEPGSTLETLDIDEGYWRATNESGTLLACYNPDACSGGQTGAATFCASGYKGPYCSVCETDYSPSLAHACTRCSSSRRQGLVVATVIAALVAVFAVLTIFKFLLSTEAEEGDVGCFRRRVLRVVPVQALKIIVVVWQILTQFADAASVSYPGVYQDFLGAIDVVNFDLVSVLAAGCLWSDVDFHGRLLVSTLGPLVVVGFLVMTYLFTDRRDGGASSDATVAEKIRNKHQTALLLLTFLVYSSVSSIVFQAFACDTLDDGVEYLRADYRIRCTDAKHKAFQVYAGIMVFVYPVGIPLLYAVLLFQRRDVLADAGADKTVARSISGLWEAFRPERYWYELVECARRIMLTGVVVFIFPNDAAQIAITMLMAFFFFAVFEVLSPYTSESDMWLSRGGHVIVFLSMFHLLVLKVDVSGERDQSQAHIVGVLMTGHVLMVAAIVVEVVGICYASRKKKVAHEEDQEATRRTKPDASV